MAVQQNTSITPKEPPKYGYDETISILSVGAVIRFSVPVHAWNKLRESKEWTDFVILLEEYQRGYVQKLHQIVE